MKKQKRELPQIVGRYFDAWIGLDTWDSFHSLDMARFYRFVKAVARYSRRHSPLPVRIRALIFERWKGRRDGAELNDDADHFAELYQTLLGYERAKGFPDPLIECRDIVRYNLRLTARGISDGQDRRTMAKVWGPDWQTKFERALLGRK